MSDESRLTGPSRFGPPRPADPAHCEAAHRRLMRRVWLVFGATIVLLAIGGWASDVMSLQGERTLYTARCVGGEWVDDNCTGHLAAAERIRFKASKPRAEVLFWYVGASAPTGRLAPCRIEDGKNWTCAESADAAKSITLALADGKPAANSELRLHSVRCISKLKWLRLKARGPA